MAPVARLDHMLWLHLIAALPLVSACAGVQTPSSAPEEFCAAVIAGDLRAAGESAHAALVEVDAVELADATQPLAAWLRAQPCVTSVRVPSVVIETEPAIREVSFELRPDADGVSRSCAADLRLAPGARVGIHPITHVTTNPDTRCTPRSP